MELTKRHIKRLIKEILINSLNEDYRELQRPALDRDKDTIGPNKKFLDYDRIEILVSSYCEEIEGIRNIDVMDGLIDRWFQYCANEAFDKRDPNFVPNKMPTRWTSGDWIEFRLLKNIEKYETAGGQGISKPLYSRKQLEKYKNYLLTKLPDIFNIFRDYWGNPQYDSNKFIEAVCGRIDSIFLDGVDSISR